MQVPAALGIAQTEAAAVGNDRRALSTPTLIGATYER